MKPIDRDKLASRLEALGREVPSLLVVMAAAAQGAVHEWVENGATRQSDAELVADLREAASATGYLARRLAGLAGAYSRKPRRRHSGGSR